MLDERLRRLMRDVALGVPLAVGLAGATTLAGCLGCNDGGGGGGGCDTQTVTRSRSASVDGGPTVLDGGGPSADGGLLDDAAAASDGGEESADADAAIDAGAPPEPTCRDLCAPLGPNGGMLTACDIGETEVVCTYEACYFVGRRPDAPYHAEATTTDDAVGRFLMGAVVAEAGSVPAFERLARALIANGAPPELAERARVSARDEVRHATRIAMLARRTIGEIAFEVAVDDAPLPGVFELALHNAREGCVGEAYAALEAAWQAEHAPDPETRAVYAEIARDEASHALLSLDIDSWARASLDARQIAAVNREKTERRAALRSELATRAPLDALGLPGGADATALLDAIG